MPLHDVLYNHRMCLLHTHLLHNYGVNLLYTNTLYNYRVHLLNPNLLHSHRMHLLHNHSMMLNGCGLQDDLRHNRLQDNTVSVGSFDTWDPY